MQELSKTFVQSNEWEKFQQSLNRKTWRIMGALCILHELPFGFRYIYVPRPEIEEKDVAVFLKEVWRIAKTEHALFLKIDPLRAISSVPAGMRAVFGVSIQPRHVLVLPITKTKDELLCFMNPKTRYNIRVAERHGVEILICETLNRKNDFATEFWNVLQETAKRQFFQTHEFSHYQKLLRIHSPHFKNILFLAAYRGRIIAGAIVNFYGHTATFLHGGTSDLHRNTMASHLLHCTIIEEAKARGMEEYDWGGIDEEKWSGVTRFKKGFGGKEVSYPETVDIIVRPFWYSVYAWYQWFRK